MAVRITENAFRNLLQDDVFVDYLNKFLTLPIFGQRIIFRKKQDSFLFNPDVPERIKYGQNEKIIKWLYDKRLPFFFRSQVYAEYKLARALMEYDLVEDGGVETTVARGLEYLQFHCFSKMSRFSKFCKFLSETGEGLKLAAFFVAAQQMFVAFYEDDPDVAVLIGEVRDRFFDETSHWCLPRKVIEVPNEQSNSIGFCMVISQRVLSRMCLYWLPRYLLHLRITDFQDDPDFKELKFTEEVQKLSETYLYKRIFEVEKDDKYPTKNRPSDTVLIHPHNMSRTSLRSLESNISLPEDRNSQSNRIRPAIESSSVQVLFAAQSKIFDRSTLLERRNTLRKTGLNIPGADIKVERKTRANMKPSMLQLTSTLSTLRTGSMVQLPQQQLSTLGGNKDRNTLMGKKSGTSVTNLRGVSTKRSLINNNSKLGTNSTLGAASVTSIANRALGVSKAIKSFKMNKKENKAKDEGSEKIKKMIKESHDPREKDEKKSDKKQKKKTSVITKEGPIGPIKESISVFKLSKTVKKGADSDKANADEEDSRKEKTMRNRKNRASKKNSKLTLATLDEDGKAKEDQDKKDEGVLKEESSTGISSIISARNVANAWKKKVTSKTSGGGLLGKLKALAPKPEIPEEETAKEKSKKGSDIKSGVKMAFAMSDQNDETDRKIKVFEKRDNRLLENTIDQSESEVGPMPVCPAEYLKKRRNALHKVKPIKTVRKRPQSEMPKNGRPLRKSKLSPEKKAEKKIGNFPHMMKSKDSNTPDGKRKMEFIKKALLAKTNIERISVSRNVAGDGHRGSIFSLNEDSIYRHLLRHFRAALRSDGFASGPFLSYLSEDCDDDSAMYSLCFWHEIEHFRESFSGMQQNDLLLAMDSILSKYVLSEKGFQLIPNMLDMGIQIIEIEILECLTFPWQLRLMQKHLMNFLKEKWYTFLHEDTASFYEELGLNTINLSVNELERAVAEIFTEELPPVPLPPNDNNLKDSFENIQENQSVTENESVQSIDEESELQDSQSRRTQVYGRNLSTLQGRNTLIRRSTFKRPVGTASLLEHTRVATIQKQSVKDPRFTMGYTCDLEVGTKSAKEIQRVAMARRSKKAYQLVEQTCMLTMRQPQSAIFIDEESDDEGFIKPLPPPVYLRKPKIDPKTMVTLATREYPSKHHGSTARQTVIRNAQKSKTPPYLKDTIRKNGMILKRPVMRPKHLIDCLRDPVHYEFFRRFARYFHIERLLKFWKAVEVMKHVDDTRLRHHKIKSIVSQFFAKGATTGVGIDGQVLRDIQRTPAEKVSVPMLISAQACIMKAMEDTWAEKYLSTFPEAKKSTAQSNGPRLGEKLEHLNMMGLRKDGLNTGKMTNIWRVFYAFIKRSAKFIRCMKNREIRLQFETYLSHVGRDPSVYHDEKWLEVSAHAIDPFMNPELMYHQRRQCNRMITAEFLLNDFRFWCDVECYRNRAESVHMNNFSGKYSKLDTELLQEKAQMICDQFLNSQVLPKCRINISAEISATIIENVKLGMLDLSLFHDCTINIFPVLLQYWKAFCRLRHQYVSRAKIHEFKNKLAKEKREQGDAPTKVRTKTKKMVNKKLQKMGLIDYTEQKRYTESWMDITRPIGEDQPSLQFSINSGVKLVVPVPAPCKKNMRLAEEDERKKA